ncbi:AMP-binding enzyme family protein [Mycobacterium ulcerans str. Harvey]|uniref:AMP-binding enzyme family protein n=1 Tax=Mycobacterium ulcerans str. Harvey TaxID=1299332 RepID=A0ABN0RAK4_MYCUL|nr:AMP-binding enzyme family protein [Mycobacterium ulcerans str. Harvey]
MPLSDGEGSLAQRLETADAGEPVCDSGGSDNLFIMYTSGTTGNPQRVVHTHDSVHTAASSWSLTVDLRYQDRLLLPLPMFHVAR